MDGELRWLKRDMENRDIFLKVKALGKSVNMCERYIQKIKTRLYRMMLMTKENRYWLIIKSIIHGMNNDYLPCLGNMTPTMVMSENGGEVLSRRLKAIGIPDQIPLTRDEQQKLIHKKKSFNGISLGDFVLLSFLSKDKKLYKGYMPSVSHSLYDLHIFPHYDLGFLKNIKFCKF